MDKNKSSGAFMVITKPIQELIDAGKLEREPINSDEDRWACDSVETLHILTEEMRKQGIAVGWCPCEQCRKELS